MSTSTSRRSPSAVHPTRQQLDDLDALLKRMLDLPVNRLEDEAEDEEEAAPSQADNADRLPTAASVPAPPSYQYNTPHPDEADLKPRVIIVAPNAPENETNSAAEAAAYSPPQPEAERQTDGRLEDWVPLTSSWRPSSRTWKPLTEAWQQAQGGRGEEENRNSPIAEPMVQNQESVDSPLPLFSSSPLPVVPLSSQEATPAPRPTPPAPPTEWTPAYLWQVVGFNTMFDLCLRPWGPIGRWLRGPTGRALLGIIGLLCLTAAAALAAADWIGWTS